MAAAQAAKMRDQKIDAGLKTLQDAQANGVVLGIKDIAGVGLRREIDDLLLNDPDVFNLYIMALKDLMRDEQGSNMFGWYRLAGIHGIPKAYWDGVTGDDNSKILAANKEAADTEESGYCRHSTTIFPSWHRPYMVIMEQTLFIKMMEIANTYGATRSRYRAAVLRFRIPFWDMFRPRSREYTAFPGIKLPAAAGDSKAETQSGFDYNFKVPYIFSAQKVMVKLAPDDRYALVENPLYSFSFPSKDGMKDSDWAVLGPEGASFLRFQTVRYPTAAKPLGDFDRQDMVMNKSRESGCIYILNLLTSDLYANFETFATDDAEAGTLPGTQFSGERKQGEKVSGSIEGFHNSWHGTVGGQLSHMSRVATAAFDPIFWLFHCNIERYHTIYESIHPDTYLTDDEHLDYPLLPFRKTRASGKTTFWTSRQVRGTESVFGYSYPDTVFTGEAEPKDMKEKIAKGLKVKERVKLNYEWSRRLSEVEPFKAPPKEMEPMDVSSAQAFDYMTKLSQLSTIKKQDAADAKPGFTKDSADAISSTVKEAWEWYVDMEVERMALDGGFTINYFMGSPVVKFRDWELAPNKAGEAYVFAAPAVACDNCGTQKTTGHKVTNTFPVTPLLLDFKDIGKIKSLQESDVLAFLKSPSQFALKYSVVNENGELVDGGDATLKSLKIGLSAKVTPLPRDRNSAVYKSYPGVGVPLPHSEVRM